MWESSSVTLSGGQSNSLSIAYNPTYGGNSQGYAIASSAGTIAITAYAVLPTITLAGMDGAGDGSSAATAMFSASGGSSGATATVNYTITNPDGSTSTSSVTLSGGQSELVVVRLQLSLRGVTQHYTISSSAGTVTVTVYAVPPKIVGFRRSQT